MMNLTTALVDLDGLLYRAAFATQKTIRHVIVEGEDTMSSFDSAKEMNEWLKDAGLEKTDVTIETEVVTEPFAHAVYVLKHMLRDIEEQTGSHQSELYLTGKDNFRHLIYDQYKANRADVVKPIHLEELRQYAITKLRAEVVDGMEADDALSIRATEFEEGTLDYWIVSQDKDLWTVVGPHYNFVTGEESIVDPYEASFNFYCQVLTGDSADNIPGIYGVGPKKAMAILDDCLEDREMYEKCLEKYLESGMTEEELVRNARLLHMLRSKDDLWEAPE